MVSIKYGIEEGLTKRKVKLSLCLT